MHETWCCLLHFHWKSSSESDRTVLLGLAACICSFCFLTMRAPVAADLAALGFDVVFSLLPGTTADTALLWIGLSDSKWLAGDRLALFLSLRGTAAACWSSHVEDGLPTGSSCSLLYAPLATGMRGDLPVPCTWTPLSLSAKRSTTAAACAAAEALGESAGAAAGWAAAPDGGLRSAACTRPTGCGASAARVAAADGAAGASASCAAACGRAWPLLGLCSAAADLMGTSKGTAAGAVRRWPLCGHAGPCREKQRCVSAWPQEYSTKGSTLSGNKSDTFLAILPGQATSAPVS